MRLVVGKESITFEGEKTTWEELPEMLAKVPNRKQTVLEFGVTADQDIPGRHPEMTRAARLAQRFGFEYLSDIGVQTLGSKGSPSQIEPPDEGRGP